MFRIIASAALLLTGLTSAEAAFQPLPLTVGSPLMFAGDMSVACGDGLEVARLNGYENVRILDCKTNDGFDYYTGFKLDPGKVTPVYYWIRVRRSDSAIAAVVAPANSTAPATGRNS